MKEKIKNNKKLILNICAVFVLICIVTGVSIAGGLWSYISTKDNVITAGEDISLTYLESTSEINLTNALPKSDNEGKMQTETGSKFEFAITTTSELIRTLAYDIEIEPLVVDTGLTGLDPSAIKVYLEQKDGDQLVEPTKISELENFKLYTNKHNHKKENTTITTKYTLKAWIDKDIEATNWYNEYKSNNTKYQYKFRINIKAKATEYRIEANAPVLDNAMIPVYYDDDSEVWKKADTTNKNNNWYDYDNKKWANSVTVSSTNRAKYLSAETGTTIPMDDILTMQVWIPRYKYKVWNYNADGTKTSNEQEIEITWEEGIESTGEITCQDAISGTEGDPSETCKLKATNETCTDNTCNKKTYTHPAFTFGDEEIKGFWIGKFELTGTIDSITTKPDLTSLTNQSISTYETNIMNMKNSGNSYGLSTTTDTHMIKNIEWGAVAYLSHSKYGTCTNGTCSEVGINNNSSYTTGCGAAAGSSSSSTCNTYNTTVGMLASTTGNIYGVYDMSGGAIERTMGNVVSSDGTTMMSGYSSSLNSGYTGKVYNSGNYKSYTGIAYPESKYYDKYSYSTSYSSRIRSKLGDGIKEVYKTSSDAWYADYSSFVNSNSSWFTRGSRYSTGASAGVFNSSITFGSSSSDSSSRLIITP